MALLIITISAGFNLYNTVNIAGERFKRYDTVVSLNEKTITEDDFDSLLKIKDLNRLILEDCSFEGNTLSCIFLLDSITSLSLDSCNISDDDFSLVELNGSELISLSLNNNEISAIEFLLPLCNTLKYLYIDENNVSDISVLSKSKNTLKQVCLSYNNISDISALSDCVQLQIITLDGNAVNNLDALENLTELTIVSANNNRIADIAGLRECKNIKYIDLSENLITAVSPLGDALSYNGQTLTVNLSNNKLTEIDTLPNGTYAFLSLYGNEISDLTPLKDKNSSVYILDYSENFDYSVLNNSYNKYYFLNCPADKQKSLEASLDKSLIYFIDAQAAEELAENQVPLSIKQ